MEVPPQAPPGQAAPPLALVPLDPRVRRLWWTSAGLAVAFLVAVAVGVDLLAPWPPPWVLPLIVLAVGAALAVLVPVVRYQRWRYAVREQDLWIRRGVLWVTTSVVPFSRLQFVDTVQGPLDRLFRLAQLVVHTAALGVTARLPGLDVAEAERLRDRLAAAEDDAPAV
jgi:membrane protein YdbS with pleckstrin-like domain